MSDDKKPAVSATRLRIGIIFLFLFWIPFWALVPPIDAAFNLNSSQTQTLTIVIMLIQTAFGLAGLVIAGKEVALVMKGTKRKQMPKKVWHIVWTGKLD